MIRLCNKTWWTYYFNKIDFRSIFKLSWSRDGTYLFGAGVNGTVVFCNIIDKMFLGKILKLIEIKKIKLIITDFQADVFVHIYFNERLINMNLGYNFLIFVPNNQC